MTDDEKARAAYLKAKEEHQRRIIQPAPFLGNLSAEKIQRAVDGVSKKKECKNV